MCTVKPSKLLLHEILGQKKGNQGVRVNMLTLKKTFFILRKCAVRPSKYFCMRQSEKGNKHVHVNRLAAERARAGIILREIMKHIITQSLIWGGWLQFEVGQIKRQPLLYRFATVPMMRRTCTASAGGSTCPSTFNALLPAPFTLCKMGWQTIACCSPSVAEMRLHN